MKWDDRYSEPGYVYGTEPNDFLVTVADRIPSGSVLCIAEGEGRNSVFLASRGYDVTAVDQSKVGLAKAQKLAEERGVRIVTVVANLADFEIGDSVWSAIVSIFCHLPPELRKIVHQRCVRGLKPGGVMIVEAFNPEQLKYGTGGPKDITMLYSLEMLKSDFADLQFEIARELTRETREGRYHTGEAAVVQLLGICRTT